MGDMVVDNATAQGANVGLLLTWMARLCLDWNSGMPVASPPPKSAEAPSGFNTLTSDPAAITNGNAKSEDAVGSLVGILQHKALRHARQELNRAWDRLDSAYAPSYDGDAKGGLGPTYNPFTMEEELFYIRNKIVTAIHQQSLVELRRALNYGLANGLSPKSLEIEAAYRDALAKHQQADGFSPEQVRDSLERCDWWTTLDVIVSTALSRGADKCSLQRTIGTFQSRQASQELSVEGTDKIGRVASV